MPRTQADNYDSKRHLIMDKAAQLFAEFSYPSSRMVDIAKACDASKSMLYHYFPKKEDLLFSILAEHLEELIFAITQQLESINRAEIEREDIIDCFVGLFVQKSNKARTRHLVAMLSVKYLPNKEQAIIQAMEREVVNLVSDILFLSNNTLEKKDYTVYALLLIGLMNSMDLWKKSDGEYSSEAISEKVSVLFTHGFSSL